MAKNSYPAPLPGYILIELPENKEKVGGFVVARDPTDKRTWAKEGKVIAVGAYENENIIHEDRAIVPRVKVGQTIYFSSFTDHPISNKVTFIKYSDIMGVKHERN